LQVPSPAGTVPASVCGSASLPFASVTRTSTDQTCVAETGTACDTDDVSPFASVTRSVTVYVPSAAYVCEGLAPVPVLPSPKFHDSPVITPSPGVLVSVNVAVS